ncbi:MAG: HAD-IIA family hydrolase [Oscillospiraceae bacterium]|nr:HAD-IIA family hydrolase [Oscillospiraceae bacterium]MBQ3049882.1 HAD-IIA family hydrolase [Oscillospiraceae bacterium]
MKRLEDIKLFLLDMDGTFYLGDKIFPGSYTFMEKINASKEKDYLFLTNNSSKNRFTYAQKISRMGITTPEEKIFTSGEATAISLAKEQKELGRQLRVCVIGTPDLEKEMENVGIALVKDNPDLVVLGFDTTLTYEKLWLLCDHVRNGVRYIATHPDFNCPTETGYMPDIGAMIACVEASTGRRPDEIIGKPYAGIAKAVSEKTGIPLSDMAMVGDRLYTDIALGANAGITTIMVKTGESTVEDVEKGSIKPDYILDEIGEIAKYI